MSKKTSLRRLIGIVGILLAAGLIIWTALALTVNAPIPPDPGSLGGEEAPAYLAALESYNSEISHTHAVLTLGVLVVVAYFFITECIPLMATAMLIPCYYGISGIMTFTDAFSGMIDSSVILFGGMFIIGGAMFQTGLAQKIGYKVVDLSKGSKARTILGICVITGIMSAFLSNTGTVAVLLPVCLGIADSQGWNRGELLFPLAIMASSGGMCTLVGTPPNMSAWTTLSSIGVNFGFFQFALVGIPVVIISIVYMMTLGKRLIPQRTSALVVKNEEKNKVYDVKKQWISGGILVLCIIVMATEVLPLAIVAVMGGIFCIITGCLTEKQAYEAVDWQTIFLFSGALGLANAMKVTGAGALLADATVNMLGGSPKPMVLMIVLFLLAGGLTQFMSNTAAAALLCPIGLSIAQSIGANPVSVVLAIGFACSAAYVTPVATPPNTMVYGPAGSKFMDFVKVGGPLFLIVGVICCILLPVFFPFY